MFLRPCSFALYQLLLLTPHYYLVSYCSFVTKANLMSYNDRQRGSIWGVGCFSTSQQNLSRFFTMAYLHRGDIVDYWGYVELGE